MFWHGSYGTSLKDETQTGTLVPHATAPVSPILGGASGHDRLLVSFQHKQCLLEGSLQLVDASFAWVSQAREFGEGREGGWVLLRPRDGVTMWGAAKGAGLPLELLCRSVCAEKRGRSASGICEERPRGGSRSQGERGAQLQAQQEQEAESQDGVGQVHADASSGLSAGTSSGLVLVFDIPPKGTNIMVSEVLEQHHDAITDIAAELGQAPVRVRCQQPLGPEEPVGSLVLGWGADGDSGSPPSPTAVLETPRRCQLWELRFTQALAMAELIPGCSPSPQEPVLSMASPIPAAGKLWGGCDVAELPQSWLLSTARESG